MGEDSNGNKYYENTGYQSGRHRWVEYADLDNYNATSVPREWHGWLHHVDDEPEEGSGPPLDGGLGRESPSPRINVTHPRCWLVK